MFKFQLSDLYTFLPISKSPYHTFSLSHPLPFSHSPLLTLTPSFPFPNQLLPKPQSVIGHFCIIDLEYPQSRIHQGSKRKTFQVNKFDKVSQLTLRH